MVDYSETGCDGENAPSSDLINQSATQRINDDGFKTKRKPDTPFLYFTAFSAVVLVLSGSSHHTWVSPVMPKLKLNNTDVNPIGRPVTTIEVSLLAGLPYLVCLIGSLFIGNIIDVFGRKRVMFCTALIIFFCDIIIAYASDIYVYIFARCVIFTSFSACLVLVPTYLLEIAEDHNRAKYGSLIGLAIPMGHVYTYIMGSFGTSVKVLTFLITIPLIPYLLCFSILAPESPVYLTAKGKYKCAIKSLEKLRANKTPQEIEKECDKISESNKTKNKNVGLIEIFKCRTSRKSLALGLIPALVQHFSGVSVIMQFMGPIFTEAGTYLSGNVVSVIAGIFKICIVFTTAMIVERFKRRFLLITSSFGSGVTLFCLGLYFYLKHINWAHLDKILWLPLLSLVCNLLLYGIGLGPMSLAVASELLPGSTRAVGMSIVVTVSGIAIFLLNFLFPIVAEQLGVYACLWFFSFSSFVGCFTIYKLLPETRGKSIVEIQKLLAD